MFGQRVVPTGTTPSQGTTLERTFASALQVIWWLAAAWLAVGFLRAFAVLGRKPSESKLVQDLLAALVYLIAVFAIVSRVFDVPLKGLLGSPFWINSEPKSHFRRELPRGSPIGFERFSKWARQM
jgi:hypothetical protein